MILQYYLAIFYTCFTLEAMGVAKNTKLKNLFKIWPMHTVASVAWLKKCGYSSSLVQRYKKSGWIRSVGAGAVVRVDDVVPWQGMVWGAQQALDLHVGGQTALALQGKSHFIRFQEKRIFLWGLRGLKLPFFLEEEKEVQFLLTLTSLFSSSTGLKEIPIADYRLRVSCPTRAFIEFLYLTSKDHGVEEAFLLMENLRSEPHEEIQSCLEACTSVKIKRLFLVLAKLHQMPWLKELNLTKIYLGSGPRGSADGCYYDSEFLIFYPKTWNKKDDEHSLF
jgi:hypothetical protein